MKYIGLILGMMAVTYIPRVVPLASLSNRPLPPAVRRFLQYIPYAALGALILPGVFTSIPQKPEAAVVGIVVAAAISWFKGGLVAPVIVSIAASFLVLNFF